jgi:hypothetical protein
MLGQIESPSSCQVSGSSQSQTSRSGFAAYDSPKYQHNECFIETIDALHKGLNHYPNNIPFMDHFATKLHCHFHKDHFSQPLLLGAL